MVQQLVKIISFRFRISRNHRPRLPKGITIRAIIHHLILRQSHLPPKHRRFTHRIHPLRRLRLWPHHIINLDFVVVVAAALS